MKWYRKAAEQNYAAAQYNLGFCYDNGEGVAKDYVEAYKWLLLAARQGDDWMMKKNMTELESKLMTPEQIADGKSGRAILSRASRGYSRPLAHHLMLQHYVPVYEPAKRCARGIHERQKPVKSESYLAMRNNAGALLQSRFDAR